MVKSITEGHIELGESYVHITEFTDKHAEETERTSKIIQNSIGGTTKTFSDNMVQIAGNISAVIMGLNSLSAAFDILNDPDLTAIEKFVSILGIAAGTLPFVITSLKETLTAIKLVMATHSIETVNLGILAVAKALNIKLTE
jgi:hypothetical protein